MFGLLTFMIFLIVGFAAGFFTTLIYCLIKNKPVRKHQFTDMADRQATIKRQVPLDSEIRTGVDGGTALSGFNKK